MTNMTREEILNIKPGTQLKLDGTYRTYSDGRPMFVVGYIDHSWDVAPYRGDDRNDAPQYDRAIEGRWDDGHGAFYACSGAAGRWSV